MGKNQKKKEPPSWRFELHQSVDALVPVPSARGGKKGGGKRSGGGLEERAGTEKPLNGDWDQIDPAVFWALVPTLPRDRVFSVCATERAAGAPVQEALDRLLALSLREEPASSGQGSSSQPTLRVARGVSVRVPQEDAGAPVPRPPVRDGDTHGIAAAVGAARRDLRRDLRDLGRRQPGDPRPPGAVVHGLPRPGVGVAAARRGQRRPRPRQQPLLRWDRDRN